MQKAEGVCVGILNLPQDHHCAIEQSSVEHNTNPARIRFGEFLLMVNFWL